MILPAAYMNARDTASLRPVDFHEALSFFLLRQTQVIITLRVQLRLPSVESVRPI